MASVMRRGIQGPSDPQEKEQLAGLIRNLLLDVAALYIGIDDHRRCFVLVDAGSRHS